MVLPDSDGNSFPSHEPCEQVCNVSKYSLPKIQTDIWNLPSIFGPWISNRFPYISIIFHIFPYISIYFQIFPDISIYFHIFPYMSTSTSTCFSWFFLFHDGHPDSCMVLLLIAFVLARMGSPGKGYPGRATR